MLQESYAEVDCEPQGTFIPGMGMVHYRPLEGLEEIRGRAIYMMKAPLSEYRVYAVMMTERDARTGEEYKTPTGRYRQKKRQLRPADASLLCRVMGSREIPDLVFGGGEGEDLVTKALSRIAKRMSSEGLDDAMRTFLEDMRKNREDCN